ncbi:Lpg1974 family pore-forming outer membrane protein [Rosistilla carotiformis]|nr:Lpg1974 family pore-forming outer membrane protein [Rosistilla carotiformis]
MLTWNVADAQESFETFIGQGGVEPIVSAIEATDDAGVFQQVGYHSICGDGNCDSCDICQTGGCDSIIPDAACTPPWWSHRTGVFGEFLFLRPGGTDTVYAIEQNDTTANAFPTGPVGTTAVDFSAGFRVGVSLANTYTTSLVVSYTHWEGDSQSSIARNGTNVLNSQIIHPSTFTTGGNSLQSSASSSMSFDQIDGVYRHKLFCTDTTIFNWSGGFRYGQMEQGLQSQQDISVATGLVTVDTDIDFNGFGLLMGIDAERRSCKTGMLCYTKGVASFLGGEWSGSYRQSNQLGGGGVVANQYEDFRITPVLEAGLGVGWQSDSGCIRATAGYTATCWYNALSTRSYVDAVRSGSYLDVDESIAFVGLTSQLEFRF